MHLREGGGGDGEGGGKSVLRVQYGAKTVKIRMGRGTKINLPVQHAIEITWDDGTPNDSAIAPDVVV